MNTKDLKHFVQFSLKTALIALLALAVLLLIVFALAGNLEDYFVSCTGFADNRVTCTNLDGTSWVTDTAPE